MLELKAKALGPECFCFKSSLSPRKAERGHSFLGQLENARGIPELRTSGFSHVRHVRQISLWLKFPKHCSCFLSMTCSPKTLPRTPVAEKEQEGLWIGHQKPCSGLPTCRPCNSAGGEVTAPSLHFHNQTGRAILPMAVGRMTRTAGGVVGGGGGCPRVVQGTQIFRDC